MTRAYVISDEYDNIEIHFGGTPVVISAGTRNLLTSFLCTSVTPMTTPAELKQILGSMAGRRVIAQEIADALNISRNAANDRMNRGLEAGDLIAVARKIGINPVDALVELGHITIQEVFDFVDTDGTLLATATAEQAIYRVAELSLTRSDKLRLVQEVVGVDELAQRRSNSSSPGVEPPIYAVADSSPDEDALREAEEGDVD